MRRLTMPRLGGLSEGAPVASSPAPNQNLLLWSEAIDEVPWVATFTTITADVGIAPDESSTADSAFFFGESASHFDQPTALTAIAGATANASFALTDSWQRRSVSGAYDGTTYHFSGYFMDNGSGGSDVAIYLLPVGGILTVRVGDIGDGATFFCWGFKLETPTLTDYVKREGI